MTARPLRATATQKRPGFRVIGGRQSRRPQMGPFVVFGIVLVASMFGLVFARTSLDAGAFQLSRLNEQIAVEEDRQRLLELEVARLESPTRIAPLAEEMGLVFPEERRTLMVDGIEDGGTDERDNTEKLVENTDTPVAMEDSP
jgi:cell division protein FtsL